MFRFQLIFKFADRFKEKIKEVINDLEGLVGNKDWERVKVAAVRLKYLQGLQKAVKERRSTM
jgi:molecular chaperone HscB